MHRRIKLTRGCILSRCLVNGVILNLRSSDLTLLICGDAFKQRRGLLTQRVVEKGLDLSTTIGAFLKVDLQQILQGLGLHDGMNPRQKDRPRTHGHLGLEGKSPLTLPSDLFHRLQIFTSWYSVSVKPLATDSRKSFVSDNVK
ncbi:hypothetical protein INR49_007423 [Caranx melampygus]|nr:hypothetical protein INR49_007423 [Caranx melampygus]